MTAANLVKNLLENDFIGPPAPDNFLNALGTSRHLRQLERERAKKMFELERAIGIERQLRKAQVTRDHVSSYIRADQAYPEKYRRFAPQKGTWPADAIVGMNLDDGRTIMFDMPVTVEPLRTDDV